MNRVGANIRRRFDSLDQARRVLDTMSYEQFLREELRLGDTGARYADLFPASACGLGSDAVSACAAWQMPKPGLAWTPWRRLRWAGPFASWPTPSEATARLAEDQGMRQAFAETRHCTVLAGPKMQRQCAVPPHAREAELI